MLARLSIVAGLVLGVAAAGLLLGGLVALTPEAPTPSVAAALGCARVGGAIGARLAEPDAIGARLAKPGAIGGSVVTAT